MKILIWIICFIIANIVQMILLAMGISGAIPVFVVYSIMFYGGKKLCDKYVGQKQSKYEMLENKKKSDEYYKNKDIRYIISDLIRINKLNTSILIVNQELKIPKI